MHAALMFAPKFGGYKLFESQIKAIMEVNRYYEQQMKAIAESIARFSDAARIYSFAVPFRAPYAIFEPCLKTSRMAARLLSGSASGYFPSREFTVLETPIKIPQKSVAMKFIERLDACPKGKDGWLGFQDLCKEIFMHLFVPPLLEPFEQSRTETGLHIRDFIFDIPYSTRDFWGYIRDRFEASAVIIECKNYSSPIEGNQIVISSKYLAKNRLGRFGIVFSRLEPAESAIKEAKRLWNEDSKLILCLIDDDLIKMLELKEKGKRPELVLDNAIHEFLRILE